jgi:uncharacterized glyoxalase superfamily protein PhnB
MEAPIRSLVPLCNVRSVPDSIGFYSKLGFRVENALPAEEDDETTWAYLVSDRAQLMVTRAGQPIDAGAQALWLYAYFDDTDAARARLVAAGVEAGPIEYPFWAPRGEFRITDPDGYVVMVTHT